MKRTILTLSITALTAMSLAACGAQDDAGSEKPADQKPAAAPASEKQEEAKAESDKANEENATNVDDVSTGGSYTATLAGEEFTVDESQVVCTEAAGAMNIAVGPTNPSGDAKAIAVVIKDDKVTALTMGSAEGKGITYAAEAGQGSATVEADGKSYTITGEGMFVDVANPGMPELKPFELQVTCG